MISAEDPECDTVEIYEAPIDAMSGATIRQYKHDRPWRSVHYLALGGLNHQPIDYFLAHHPAVKTQYSALTAMSRGGTLPKQS